MSIKYTYGWGNTNLGNNSHINSPVVGSGLALSLTLFIDIHRKRVLVVKLIDINFLFMPISLTRKIFLLDVIMYLHHRIQSKSCNCINML